MSFYYQVPVAKEVLGIVPGVFCYSFFNPCHANVLSPVFFPFLSFFMFPQKQPRRSSVKMFLKVLKNSHENTCGSASFLVKLQASELLYCVMFFNLTHVQHVLQQLLASVLRKANTYKRKSFLDAVSL